MTMQAIGFVELTAAQSSITFSQIPQTFTDLLIVFSLRDTTNSITNNMILELNGVTTNATERTLWGNGSSAFTHGDTPIYVEQGANSNNATANTFSNGQIYIPNYAGSTNKSLSIDSVSENNGTFGAQAIVAGLWANTAAITAVRLRPNGSVNYVAGSTATLYGITKGSDGVTTVS